MCDAKAGQIAEIVAIHLDVTDPNEKPFVPRGQHMKAHGCVRARFVIPPGLPHSPQRPANTVGLVIERARRAGELDGFQWYCERCGHRLYEEFFPLTDIEKQFPPVFERFFANLQKRTCARCGTVMERA